MLQNNHFLNYCISEWSEADLEGGEGINKYTSGEGEHKKLKRMHADAESTAISA